MSSAAVIGMDVVLPGESSSQAARWPRAAIVAVGDRGRALARATIAVQPGAHASTIDERDDPPTPDEIVPLLAIEHWQKFRIVETIDLAAHAAGAFDQPRIAAEVEQAAAHRPVTEAGDAASQGRVQAVA